MTSTVFPQPEAWTIQLYETLLRHVPEALLVVNADGRVLFSNHGAHRLLGYSDEQLRFSSVVNSLPDWFTLPLTGSVLETTAVNADGRSLSVELKLAPIETPSGPLLVCLIRDSSSRTAELAGFAAEQENLREQIQELSLRERDLKSEMDQAATILEAHLPPRDFSMPGVQVAWRFSPCFTLGGDMVKLFGVSDSLLAFCILDVSGHGIPASLLAISLARSLSTERARGGILERNDGKLRQPTAILTKLNEQYQILHEGEQFVTLLYGILDKSQNRVHYVSAGHPHPLRFATGGVSQIEGPINPPVGVLRSASFEETMVELSDGEALFFYTDGVTETRNPSGEMFDEFRLIECVEREKSRPPSEILASLYAELKHFRFGREQTDDVTALILKVGNS